MTNRFAEVIEMVAEIKGEVTKDLLALKGSKTSKLSEIRSQQFEGDKVFAKKRLDRGSQRNALALVEETNDFYKKTVAEAHNAARLELVKEPIATLSQLEHDEFRNKLSSLSTRSQLGMNYKAVQAEIKELVQTYESDKKLMKQLGESYLTLTGASLNDASVQEKTDARLQFERIEELSLSDVQIDAKRALALPTECAIFKADRIHSKMLKDTFNLGGQMISNPATSIAKLDEEKAAEDKKMQEMYA